jgi:hypothetical protein
MRIPESVYSNAQELTSDEALGAVDGVQHPNKVRAFFRSCQAPFLSVSVERFASAYADMVIQHGQSEKSIYRKILSMGSCLRMKGNWQMARDDLTWNAMGNAQPATPASPAPRFGQRLSQGLRNTQMRGLDESLLQSPLRLRNRVQREVRSLKSALSMI